MHTVVRSGLDDLASTPARRDPGTRRRKRIPYRAGFDPLEGRTLLSADPVRMASINLAGTAAGNNYSQVEPHALSADGRYLVFTSRASDLVAGDTTGKLSTDVYVRDLATGSTNLVSIDRAGTTSGNNSSFHPVISANGRYVAFVSAATDLVSTPLASIYNVFVRDLVAHTTQLVSVNAAGTAGGNHNSDLPSISDDGHVVAFQSLATDLVSDVTDTFGTNDVFARDLTKGVTRLVSINAAGTAVGNGQSGGQSFGTAGGAVVSGDGSTVAFVSAASDLTAIPDTNGENDVFARNLNTGMTRLVSIRADGQAAGNGQSESPALSANGQTVAFRSRASDLVSDDANGALDDVFVRDPTVGTTSLIDVNAAGTGSGNGGTSTPSLSRDGRYVAFESYASDLVSPPAGGISPNVFVRDRTAGTTQLVSHDVAGTGGGNGWSFESTISGDGSTVAFASLASNLVANDTNNTTDVFVWDRATGVTRVLSTNAAGTGTGNDQSRVPSLSADGSVVAFYSWASDLTSVSDSNQGTDVFALAPAPLPTLSIGDAKVVEGDAGTRKVLFTVRLSAATDHDVAVAFTTADGTARTRNNDYLARAGTLVIHAGSTSGVIAVLVRGDTRNEPDETFSVVLSGPAGATLARSRGVGTILNDDSTVSISDVRRKEGNRGLTAFTFTVRLSRLGALPVRVSYQTVDGTARAARGDYRATRGTLTFSAHQRSKTITVWVRGDSIFEGPESFRVRLSRPTYARIADAIGVGTILNDDRPADRITPSQRRRRFPIS